MRSRLFRTLLGACLAVALIWFVGCSKHEHRKVQMHEEQHEGEVVEEQPGEMVVE